MPRQPSVLLLDDGELDHVRALLEALGCDFVHLRGGAIPDRVEPPRQLLIATVRRARLAADWPGPKGDRSRPARIAVVTEDSTTARLMLRRLGFDFLIRRSVHPEALRLLVTRFLFAGEERRSHPRSPIGYEITYRSGLQRKRAILADLAPHSLSLFSTRPVPLGAEVTVHIPLALEGKPGFSVKGRVIRADERRGLDGRREFVVAVDTTGAEPSAKARIAELLDLVAEGPLAADATGVRAASGATASPPEQAESSLEERRRHRRGAFERQVVADYDTNARVLVGRDLSRGGMRVDPDPSLRPRQRLRLALYASSGQEPFLVGARVTRNDGVRGVGLEFENLDPEVARRLEALVASLPAVESLHDGEVGSLGTVVSQILPDAQEG